MKVYRPLKSERITQKFGENLPCAKVDGQGNVIRPYQIITPDGPSFTCPVGYKKFYPLIGLTGGHNGWDIAAKTGEEVRFSVEAEIPGVEWLAVTEIDNGAGICVRVYSMQPIPIEKIPFPGGGQFKMIEQQYQDLGGKLYLEFNFCHLQQSLITKPWTPVKFNQVLGYADSTGAASGPHLHFNMKAHNGKGFSIDVDNGVYGAQDFAPWYVDLYVADIPLYEKLLKLIELLKKILGLKTN